MRYDKDLAVFGKHFDWYKVVYGVGYVPTDKAPEYAKTAMDNYNKKHIKNNKDTSIDPDSIK